MDVVDYIFFVRTGDRKNAGTDANIKVILYGDSGKRQIKLGYTTLSKMILNADNLIHLMLKNKLS